MHKQDVTVVLRTVHTDRAQRILLYWYRREREEERDFMDVLSEEHPARLNQAKVGLRLENDGSSCTTS